VRSAEHHAVSAQQRPCHLLDRGGRRLTPNPTLPARGEGRVGAAARGRSGTIGLRPPCKKKRRGPRLLAPQSACAGPTAPQGAQATEAVEFTRREPPVQRGRLRVRASRRVASASPSRQSAMGREQSPPGAGGSLWFRPGNLRAHPERDVAAAAIRRGAPRARRLVALQPRRKTSLAQVRCPGACSSMSCDAKAAAPPNSKTPSLNWWLSVL